jgi:hypothetical protein
MEPPKAKQPRTARKGALAETPSRIRRTPRVRKAPGAETQTDQNTAAARADEPRADREQMIREAAYFKAERRGFAGGSPEQDWLEAEAEIERVASPERGAAGQKR